jgi:small subunit ribosomal protein S17
VSTETTTTNASDASLSDARGKRRLIQGLVTSAAMDKTVVVTVIRRIRDKHFHKFLNRKVKYRAHDEENSCRTGDRVELVASKPYSKTKRWRVIRTIEKAREQI